MFTERVTAAGLIETGAALTGWPQTVLAESERVRGSGVAPAGRRCSRVYRRELTFAAVSGNDEMAGLSLTATKPPGGHPPIVGA
jgi:hypothetical protein